MSETSFGLVTLSPFLSAKTIWNARCRQNFYSLVVFLKNVIMKDRCHCRWSKKWKVAWFGRNCSAVKNFPSKSKSVMLKTFKNSTLPNGPILSRTNFCISTFHLILNAFLDHLGLLNFSSKLRSQTIMKPKRDAKKRLKTQLFQMDLQLHFIWMHF